MILDHLNFPMLNPHRQVCKYGPHLFPPLNGMKQTLSPEIWISFDIFEVCPFKGTPYAAILLCEQIILNRDVILHCTIPKPYIHWKGTPFVNAMSRTLPFSVYMVLVCDDKEGSFYTILTTRQNCLLGVC